ncbi:MAG: Ger(x)C family spore germination protein [Bacilli bacterium]|nr:Ger(x)C family spore germination protein [Bacilli bacterium]
MKRKIIILLLFLLFITGCYDYQELNNLGIVTGIAIDYKDDKYNVTLEILNDKKESISSSLEAYTISSDGTNIAQAFTNVNEKLDKQAFYPHTKVVIISEEIAKNHIKDIADYILRNQEIRDQFYLLVAVDTSSEDIITSQQEDYPVVANRLVSMLEKDYNNKNITSTLLFEKNMNTLLNNKKDIVLTTVYKEEDNLKFGGLATFKDFKMQNILTNEESITYNLFVNKGNNALFSYQCNNNIFTINIYDSNSKIQYKNNRINIDLNLGADVIYNDCAYDLKNSHTIEELESKFNKLLKDKVNKLIVKLMNDNTDILGLNKVYYNKHRHDIDFRLLNYKINVDLKINKEGSIFEVNYEN